MMYRIDINGTIVPNEDKEVYEWFGMDSTCPNDVKEVINQAGPDDEIDVYINSPGGVIQSGSEIYTLLREAATSKDVKIYVVGEACSAASVIACAAYCEMAPTALMMVHCVSTKAEGNHSDMEKMADVLRTADKALCTAYMAKAGMTEEEALAMMEAETWLTAEQAKEKGLVDAVMFEEEQQPLVAGPYVLSDEQLVHIRSIMTEEKNLAAKRKQAATLRLETLKQISND